MLSLEDIKNEKMNIELRDTFISLWRKYFGPAELPVTFYYSHADGGAPLAMKARGWKCIICELAKVRNGMSLVYNAERLACGGARRYLGYTDKMSPGFEHFLSCGNERIEGERYLQSPALVREFMKNQRTLPVSGMNIVFKRWDKLGEKDEPDVVIFFALPDVLSGLFTLANFDQYEPNGTFAPFGSGCAAIIHHPYLETLNERQRAVIGMFDPSARKCVQENVITFAVPMKRFQKMINFMEESFLITDTWSAIRKRIK